MSLAAQWRKYNDCIVEAYKVSDEHYVGSRVGENALGQNNWQPQLYRDLLIAKTNEHGRLSYCLANLGWK